jgi:HKD family nuclease
MCRGIVFYHYTSDYVDSLDNQVHPTIQMFVNSDSVF